MNPKDIDIINSLLGEGFLDELNKSEITGGIMKLNTNTATDPEEIKLSLQIVPRSVLSFLFMHLKSYNIGAAIDLDLPFADNAKLVANKLSNDNYSGEIIQNGKRLAEFKYRSLAGVGLMIMSAFELYDLSQLDEIKQCNHGNESKMDKLQDLIDERIKLNHLIESVVSNKIAERDAINQIIMSRLNQHIMQVNKVDTIEENEESEIKEDNMSKCKLKNFLENREEKKQETDVEKSEILCPDCKSTLYKGGEKVKLCLCYGEYFGKSLKLTKSKNGKIKIKFPKKFDIDNVQMLLDALKNN